jgi:hypothetical protein
MTIENQNSLSIEAQFNVLFTHYKDTHSIVVCEKKIRERALLLACLAITIHCFSIFNEALITDAANSIFDMKFGVKLMLNINVVNSFVWLLLFTSLLRYCQANLYINRLYAYLHDIEDKFSAMADSKIIGREGEHLFKNYPPFLHWITMIYTWLAPALLLTMPSIKIYSEIVNKTPIGFLLFNVTIFASIVTSLVFYVLSVHGKTIKYFNQATKQTNALYSKAQNLAN